MPLRSPTIVGIAVDTIVLSRLARNIPDIAATIVMMMRLRERRAAYAVRSGGALVMNSAISESYLRATGGRANADPTRRANGSMRASIVASRPLRYSTNRPHRYVAMT